MMSDTPWDSIGRKRAKQWKKLYEQADTQTKLILSGLMLLVEDGDQRFYMLEGLIHEIDASNHYKEGLRELAEKAEQLLDPFAVG